MGVDLPNMPLDIFRVGEATSAKFTAVFLLAVDVFVMFPRIAGSIETFVAAETRAGVAAFDAPRTFEGCFVAVFEVYGSLGADGASAGCMWVES